MRCAASRGRIERLFPKYFAMRGTVLDARQSLLELKEPDRRENDAAESAWAPTRASSSQLVAYSNARKPSPMCVESLSAVSNMSDPLVQQLEARLVDD